MKKIITVLLLLFLNAQSFGQRTKVITVESFSQYEEVLKIAESTDQLIFIILNNNSSTLSQMVDQGIFKEAALNEALNQSIPCMVNANSDMGARLLQAFDIDSFPAFLILDKDETLLQLTQGYQSSAALLTALNEAQRNDSLYPKLQQAYIDQELTQVQWPLLLEIYGLNHPFMESQSLAMQYFAGLNNDQLLSVENLPLLIKYGISLETPYPKLILNNSKRIKSAYPAFDADAFFESTYNFNLDLAIISEDSLLLEKICKVLIPHDPAKAATSLTFETKKEFATETDYFHFYVRAADAFVAAQDSALNDTAEFYYDEAFFIADNFATPASQEAARSLSLKAFEYQEDFRYKMLAGYMSYLLEEYDLAKQYVEEAKGLTDLNANLSKAENLLKMIEKASGKEESNQSGLIQYSE